MKYVGSKNSIAKYILQYVLSERVKGQWYIEPFVGGANIIDKVTGNRIGSDANYYLIELLKNMSKGWIPPENITEQEYNHIKSNKEKYSPELVAYAGLQMSFGSVWFSGFRKDKTGGRDYSRESYRNIVLQSRRLKNVIFKNCNYNELEIPDNSIIYCDPPYRNTSGYMTGKFNHDKFWRWIRQQIKKEHKVYISEYQAPDDFIEIWAKTKNNTLEKNTGAKKGIEKLFIHESQQNNTFYF